MTDEVMERVKNAPASPGAYLMKDRDGKVIYVGKANNLRSRVWAYFGGKDSRFMAPFLISKIHDVEFIVTETEKEALILENTLIKEHRPRYNVIFRDDKTYFNIRIDLAGLFPRFQLVRRPKKDGAYYFVEFFGKRDPPFSSVHISPSNLHRPGIEIQEETLS
jgi:excinuclease ABC subunit C